MGQERNGEGKRAGQCGKFLPRPRGAGEMVIALSPRYLHEPGFVPGVLLTLSLSLEPSQLPCKEANTLTD